MGERVRIGKRAIDGMQPGSIVWDTEVAGFGARRQRDTVAYVLKARTRFGRQLFLTIGRHGSPWTPDTARTEARRLLHVIAEGRDPAAERTARRQAPTVAALARRFLKDVEIRRKERTARDYARLYERHIRPEFGGLKLAELTRARIVEWHNARIKTPVEANRALAVLKRMLNLARRWGLHDGENPATAVEMFREKPRDRVSSTDELVRIGNAMSALPVPVPVRRAIVLLATTGARSSEVRRLRWEDVDFVTKTAALRDTKNGADRVLGLDTLAVVALTPADESGFVCPALTDASKPLSEATLWYWWLRILAEAEVVNLRIHDLRHGLATQAARHGASALIVRDLLGHKTLAMANRYVARVQEEATAAQQRAGATIGSSLLPVTQSAEIVGLKRPA